ncbi:hypothetical protein Glove_372g40 [Diversispora epigaea]|uniref:BTB domain-containing protein n=1 Tax=Diversispora epigaea TaxID=1348612 RepID=A0A397HAB8_9GLOM|nr:hypothetical protein Glove_372g40 [Diversispora epigaea]
MKFKFLDKLSQDFLELLNDKEEYNVVFEVDQNRDIKTFTAHSTILRCRSSYFNQELTNTASDNHIKTISKPKISAQVFEIIIKYIYGGAVDTEILDTKTIYKLMIVANEFELKELSVELEKYLIDFKASWLKTHFSLVYHSIYKSDDKFNDLKNFYNTIITKYPNLIFGSIEFTSIHESALVSILKQDDLQMIETEIWDYVIKWGIARSSNLPKKLEDWSDENFLTLKTTLQQCLPLIRYFHMSILDVMNKIKPYKKIFDKQLWNDLTQYLSHPNRSFKSTILPPRSILIQKLPSRVNESFSNIISRNQAAEISSWIDCKSTSYHPMNNPYKFQLILRGSKDGFAPRKFWDLCDGYARTIVVSKIKETNQIVGGYNPLVWDKSKYDWMETDKSFIFSFKDSLTSTNPILSRVKEETCALWYPSDKDIYGPRFGLDEFMMKSHVSNFTQDKQNKCMSSCYNSYEKSIRTTNDEFSIIDYEVFRIIKKY